MPAALARIELNRSKLKITFSYDPQLVALVKTLPGAKWNPEQRYWSANIEALGDIQRRKLDHFLIDPAAARRWKDAQTAAHVASARAATLAHYWREKLKEPINGINLYEHQRTGAEWLIKTRRAILADDMGTGKTITALVAASAYQIPILVICPTFLQANWQREAERLGITLAGVYSWDYRKIPAPPQGEYGVIADEAHYIMSPQAKRTKAFFKLEQGASFVFMLTGTPLKNGRPANLFSLLKVCRHDLAKNQRAYEVRYCGGQEVTLKNGRTFWKADRATNVAELRNRIAPIILRRTKAETLDLPPLTQVYIEADPTPESERQYKEVFNRKIAEWRARMAGPGINDVQAVVELTYLRIAASFAKVQTTAEMLEEAIENKHPALVFIAYKEPIPALIEAIKKNNPKARVECIIGDTPLGKRDLYVQQFQAGHIDVLIMTYGAGGVGLTLTESDLVILHDRPWAPEDITQATSRAHRNGQTRRVTEVWIAYGDVDPEIDSVLKVKAHTSEQVLGDKVKALNTGRIARRVLSKLLKMAEAGNEQ